jgi:hypothetical protein
VAKRSPQTVHQFVIRSGQSVERRSEPVQDWSLGSLFDYRGFRDECQSENGAAGFVSNIHSPFAIGGVGDDIAGQVRKNRQRGLSRRRLIFKNCFHTSV